MDGAVSRGAIRLESRMPHFEFVDEDRFQSYKEAVVVKNVSYNVKNGKATKKLGKPLGLWHPLFSTILLLDEFDWKIYNLISSRESVSAAYLLRRFNDCSPMMKGRIDRLYRGGYILRNNEVINITIAPTFDTAEMYIKTTEGCNFSCPGCATASDIIPPHLAKTISLETANLFLESYIRSCNEKKINEAEIKWAGGEPLLANSFRIVFQAQDRIKKLRFQYPHISINQSILTNGVFLNDEKIAFAKNNGIHMSVSLWGTQAYQDKIRRPRNDMETFPIIIDHIRKLHDAGLSFNVNYVITPDNALDFERFITLMWDVHSEEFIGRRWKVKNPLPLGIAFFRPQSLLQIKAIPEGYKKMENGLRLGLAKVSDMISRGIKIQPLHKIDYLDLMNIIATPCGSGYSYVAIGPDGATSCHEGLYQMKNNLQRIQAGENLFDVVNEEYSNDRSFLLGNNIQFEKGKHLAFHGGQGCPRLARIENKGKLGKASSTSYLYNAVYEELLSLEVVRQLNGVAN